MKFVIFKTKVEISFLFLAFLTILIFTDKSGNIIPMIISVIFHEIAHLLSMRLFGCQPKLIRLIPGSVEVVRGFCDSCKSEILISVSGPFLNFLLFIIFYKINLSFAVINLLIGVFNMLPLNGLDGGEIVIKILSQKLGEEQAKRVLYLINLIVSLIGICITIFLFVNNISNLSVIIMSIYLLLSVIFKL